MQRNRLARYLAIGALAWAGILVGAGTANAQDPTPTPEATAAPKETQSVTPQATAAPAATTAPAASTAPSQTGSGSTVQSGNTSTGAAAASGPAASGNGAVVSAGPSANGGSGQSSQIGNNNVTVVQDSNAKSGDAVAGSQVTGVVGGNATVQNQNNSTGAVAVSGPAVAVNGAAVNAGPSSNGGSTQQLGSNNATVIQSNTAESGSAVAGSQVTGVVGTSSVVQNQNTAFAPVAVSGAAVGVNAAFVGAGPSAFGGQAAQVGRNDAVLIQSSDVQSGDALAGAQTTGLVGGSGTVQNQNVARNPVAVSGFAVAANVGTVNAGPTAIGLGSAQASQLGGNSVLAAQEANVSSGDAIAGGQVTGMVSSQLGHLTVQNQQASDTPVAVSGPAGALNVLATAAGPASVGVASQTGQIGSNRVNASQLADADTGDAVAGGQVLGAVGAGGTVQSQNTTVGAVAVSGPSFAVNAAVGAAGPASVGVVSSTQQFGNNVTEVDQVSRASSGDAVSGGQVFGIVGGAGTTIQASNTAVGAFSFSGPAVAANFGVAAAGPLSLGGVASASQIGSNRTSFNQEVVSASGDAISGGQVVGIVGGLGNTVQLQNASALTVAVSGPAVGLNFGVGLGGPVALGLGGGPASVSQVGGNTVNMGQLADSSTGDAVSGSQVVGIAGGLVNRIQGSNTSFGALAFTTFALSANAALGGAGPVANSAGGTATTSQFGSNVGRAFQAAPSATGDAIAGSEVFGVVF